MSRLAVAVVLGLALAVPASTRAQALGARELAAEAPALLRELARLRGVPAGGAPPRVVVRTREERRRFVLGEFRRKYPTARLEADRRGLAAWGLVPSGFDLGGFLADLVVEQAAAYYDPAGKTLILANWLGRDAQREALTHELVHLLQDRQIDLERFLAGSPGHADEALARQSVVEGEAVALALDRTLHRQGGDLAALPDVAALQRAITTSGTGPVLGRAPRFLRTLLTFPYARGVAFVHAFVRRHGWAEFSRLYADPPRSTAQILHPGRYLDTRRDPAPVRVPDLGPALGARAHRVVEDEVGEFGLAGVLKECLGEDIGAAGWQGDRYAVWDDGGGGTVLVALSAWEDEAAAAAFAEAYARCLVAKHRLPPAERAAWEVDGRAFGVERRERRVLLYEGVPAAASDAVRRGTWATAPPPG